MSDCLNIRSYIDANITAFRLEILLCPMFYLFDEMFHLFDEMSHSCNLHNFLCSIDLLHDAVLGTCYVYDMK